MDEASENCVRPFENDGSSLQRQRRAHDSTMEKRGTAGRSPPPGIEKKRRRNACPHLVVRNGDSHAHVHSLSEAGEGTGQQQLSDALRNFKLGLRWGRKIKRGEIRADEQDEDEQPRLQRSNLGSDEDCQMEKLRKVGFKLRLLSRSSSLTGKSVQLLPHPCCSTCETTLHRPFLCLDCAEPACFFVGSDDVTHLGDCLRLHLRQKQHSLGE